MTFGENDVVATQGIYNKNLQAIVLCAISRHKISCNADAGGHIT